MSTILEFAIFPTDKGESVSPWVAKAVRIVRESGLPYTIGPMGSCVEGEFHQVLEILQECHRMMSGDCNRVYISAVFDSKRGKSGRLQGKLDSVNNRLQTDADPS